MQKALELFRRDQFPKQTFFYFNRNRLRFNKLTSDLFANPLLFFFTLNVTIFDADLAAVSALQNVENLAQRHALAIGETVGDERSIEIPDRQAVILDVQLRVIENRERVQRI